MQILSHHTDAINASYEEREKILPLAIRLIAMTRNDLGISRDIQTLERFLTGVKKPKSRR